MLRIEETKGELVVSTDRARLELDRIHAYLCERSYWARGIPKDRLLRAIENSACVGVYQGTRQAAFARVISDLATFAYLCDVSCSRISEGGRSANGWSPGCRSSRPSTAYGAGPSSRWTHTACTSSLAGAALGTRSEPWRF